MHKRHAAPLGLALLFAAIAPASSQNAAPPPAATGPSPGEVVAAAPAGDWVDIAPADLLVMTLAPDASGKPRNVLIQLLPPPFSQGWVGNIRTMAKAHYWDGLAIYRVQDNYVTQWGDAEDDEAKARKLPAGLKAMTEADYEVRSPGLRPLTDTLSANAARAAALTRAQRDGTRVNGARPIVVPDMRKKVDPYSDVQGFVQGWPIAGANSFWPVHCYGMVGVARGLRPSTGDGSTLYTVIGHAPRHLDRNIALAGRVIEGMEHLSSLPRGPGAQGFYENAAMRVPIVSVRLASDLPAAEQPRVQYLSTESDSFTRYADARANRRDAFFLVPAGGADICNVPVPIRRKP